MLTIIKKKKKKKIWCQFSFIFDSSSPSFEDFVFFFSKTTVNYIESIVNDLDAYFCTFISMFIPLIRRNLIDSFNFLKSFFQINEEKMFQLVRTWIKFRLMWWNDLKQLVIPSKNYRNKQRSIFKDPNILVYCIRNGVIEFQWKKENFPHANPTQSFCASHFSLPTENARKKKRCNLQFLSKKYDHVVKNVSIEVGLTISTETSMYRYFRLSSICLYCSRI